MFDHFVWSVLVVPPLVVVAVRLLADRLPPGRAAAVIAWSAAVTATASTANLALFTVAALAEVPAVAAVLGWSPAVVAHDTASVPWVPWVSLAMLAAVTAAAGRRWRGHLRILRLAAAGGPAQRPLVLVPDETADAFAVPGGHGRRGHVVVTTGMRELLTDPQFEALLAHERAHLAGRHHRLVLLANLAGAAHPALWWVRRHVAYLVERAADEDAAAHVGNRRTVAHAIGTAALATSGGRPRGLHAALPAGVVPRRVALLLHPRPAAGRMALLAALALIPALALASVVWTGEATVDLVELLIAAAR
ncbi:M56 family metallopeptidase [Dactylosporangium sucinum]|uniref:Membrane protein n=1 Tax=Dactylosporangium sucinum TaxID=1424081 RepID=A0A917TWK5_9ACTN|nr:M56 family metallopeptidase [Dactylosporangium sucinum]GGM40364.1 membrane protein [Dactylosporangium sucinum]